MNDIQKENLQKALLMFPEKLAYAKFHDPETDLYCGVGYLLKHTGMEDKELDKLNVMPWMKFGLNVSTSLELNYGLEPLLINKVFAWNDNTSGTEERSQAVKKFLESQLV